MYSLVIVDMQHGFVASRKKPVIRACEAAIAKAIQDEAAIIFVEFLGYGASRKTLRELTDNYYKTFVVRKGTDDGSREVSKVIKDNKLPSKIVKVCGVNTDFCVKATVRGLTSKMPRSTLEVLAKACNSNGSHSSGLAAMATLNKVIINEEV